LNSIELYKKFLIDINKNDTNTNIKINKGEFVLIFNRNLLKWLRNKIDNTNNSSKKNEIEQLLIYDKELKKIKTTENFVEFELPDDYFDIETSYSIAEKETCKRKLYNWDFKARNRNSLEQNENQNPSFEYEETLVNISNGKFLTFKTDFKILKQYLTYFKQPKFIDLEGYIKIDGTPSKNIDSDLYDIYTDEILDICVIETKNKIINN